MKIVDLATSIYLESGEPTYTSIPAIAFYLRNQIGRLNSLVFEDFTINDQGEVVNSSGEISIDATAILQQIYRIYDLQVQVNNNMNALAGTDAIIEVADKFGGQSFKKVNRNEIAKTLISIRKDEIAMLNTLIGAYHINKAKPLAVNGDDCVPAPWGEALISLRNV
jgi:hypothetical protein